MSNYVTQLNRKIAPQNVTGTTDDTDVAFWISYHGDESTATIDVNTAVANTVRIVIGATTSDFLLTSSSYDTFGELQDALEALDGVRVQRAGTTRAANTYSSDCKILALAATTMKDTTVPGGVAVYLDSSTVDYRALGIGTPFLVTTNTGATVPFEAKNPMSTVPWNQDPIYNNYPPDDGTAKYSPGYGACLEAVNFVGTYSTYATVTITPCTNLADGTPIVIPCTSATTGVALALGTQQLGAEGIDTLGGWIVVSVAGTSNMSASSLSCNGYITYSGGQTS